MANCRCHSINLQLDVVCDASEKENASVLMPSAATKFRLILSKGDRATCGNCDCTSIVIATEACKGISPSSGTDATPSTTSVTMESRKRITTTHVKQHLKTGEDRDNKENESSRPKKRTRDEDGEQLSGSTGLIPVIIQYNDDGKRPLGMDFTLPDGKRLKLTLPGQNAIELSPNTNVTSYLQIVEDANGPNRDSSYSTQMEEICCLVEKLGGQSVTTTKHLLATKHGSDQDYLLYREQLRVFRTTRHSLENLITSKEQRLTRAERLQICLTLSISLLYFGSYSASRSFFQERWRSRDIFFFDNTWSCMQAALKTSEVRGFIPYVVPRFSTAALQQIPQGEDENIFLSPNPVSIARNELLFSLAVVLIETAMGQPLFQIRPTLNIGQPGDPLAEFVTATRVADSGVLIEEIGARFSDVVGRCIWCRFDGLSNYDLTTKEMQVAYYQTIVSQLNNILKHFRTG